LPILSTRGAEKKKGRKHVAIDRLRAPGGIYPLVRRRYPLVDDGEVKWL
jgi:hypothetical protein